MLNVAVEQGAVTSVDGVVGLLAGFAELVGHGLVALRDTEFCKCLFLGHGAAPSIEVVVDGLLVVMVGLFVIAEVLAECRPTDAVEFLVRQLGCGVAADEACKEECGGDD